MLSNVTNFISVRTATQRQLRQCQLRMYQTVQPSKARLERSQSEKQDRFSLRSPINPNKPRMLPKTSTTRILTNRVGSAASARAAVEPVIPTQTPQRRLQAPTVMPPQKTAKPNAYGVRETVTAIKWMRRTCEVIFASIHHGIRDRVQFSRVDNSDDLGEGVVRGL